jgi:FixJ family two-component response regulator
VILVSGVRDDYLWQEVIRRGGYDVLPKPLRADSVARIVKLALSYWKSAPKRVASGAKSSPEISLAALRLLRKRLEPKATLEAVEEAVLPPEDPLR